MESLGMREQIRRDSIGERIVKVWEVDETAMRVGVRGWQNIRVFCFKWCSRDKPSPNSSGGDCIAWSISRWKKGGGDKPRWQPSRNSRGNDAGGKKRGGNEPGGDGGGNSRGDHSRCC